MSDAPKAETGEDMLESPCVGICQLGLVDQVCLGCGRHIEEIARWNYASSEQQREIIELARARLGRWKKPKEE